MLATVVCFLPEFRHNARKAAHVSYITNTASEVRRCTTTGIRIIRYSDGTTKKVYTR